MIKFGVDPISPRRPFLPSCEPPLQSTSWYRPSDRALKSWRGQPVGPILNTKWRLFWAMDAVWDVVLGRNAGPVQEEEPQKATAGTDSPGSKLRSWEERVGEVLQSVVVTDERDSKNEKARTSHIFYTNDESKQHIRALETCHEQRKMLKKIYRVSDLATGTWCCRRSLVIQRHTGVLGGNKNTMPYQIKWDAVCLLESFPPSSAWDWSRDWNRTPSM